MKEEMAYPKRSTIRIKNPPANKIQTGLTRF